MKEKIEDYNFCEDHNAKLPCPFEAQCANFTAYSGSEPYQVYTCKNRNDNGTCGRFKKNG